MPALLIGLFELGTVGFWILILIATLFVFFMTELEEPAWATASLILVFVTLACCGDFNLWHVLRANPVGGILAVIGYVVIGATWSVGKWWFFVRERRANYQEFRDRFMNENKLPLGEEIPNGLKKGFKERLARNTDKLIDKPVIQEHKARLSTWMTFWPWSMTWTMINDPVKKMFRWVLEQLQGVYQHMADSIFKGTENDTNYIEEKVTRSDEN